MSFTKLFLSALLLVWFGGACAQTEGGAKADTGSQDTYQGEVALDAFVPPNDGAGDTDLRDAGPVDALPETTTGDTAGDAISVDATGDANPRDTTGDASPRDTLTDASGPTDTIGGDALTDTPGPTDTTGGDALTDASGPTDATGGDALTDTVTPTDTAPDAPSDTLADSAQDTLDHDTVAPCGGPCPEGQVCHGPTDQCVPDPRCVYDFCPSGPYGTSRLEIGGTPVYMEVLEGTEEGATLPTDRLNFERAAGACLDRGRRLCTVAEYQKVCGAAGSWFYGASYDAQVCNTEGEGPAASGSHGACAVGSPAVFDLIGNLAEWTLEGLLFGGSYMDGAGARCTALNVEDHGTLNLATLGFRCCVSPVDDLDGDGTLARDDCDDMDPLVNPRADEACNGLDDDCDGETDEGDLDFLCDDGDQCRQEFCERGVGCKDQHLSGLCDDGEPCTVEDKCVDGTCMGSPRVCDDHKACTQDKCVQGEGCVYEFVSSECDDGDLCTVGDYCTDGVCTAGETANCDDANDCTDDSCEAATGCAHTNNTAWCDNADGCDSTYDFCVDGACVGVAGTVCICTTDVDCLPYEDGNLCNGTRRCNLVENACEIDPATIKTCPESNDPCKANVCDPDTGDCVLGPANNGFACDDGQGCTAEDICEEGVCAGQSCAALGRFCYLGACVDCVPDCGGKLCGDDGCGGACGLCELGQECNDGTCCTPSCPDIHCGDNGCGGVCGLCLEGQVCTLMGMCCTPHCEGRTCGADGCGRDCGTCAEGALCTHGNCCVPACDGKNCGDDGCGGVCGACPFGGSCIDGLCCLPDCSGKVCGSDGCGGTCGGCSGDLTCVLGQCKGCGDGKCEGGETNCNCATDCGDPCAGKVCGDSGCGGICGTCTLPKTCQAGACVCTPSCAGKTCGSDGCGGVCGTCTTGNICSVAGVCTKATFDGTGMVKSIFNKTTAKCAQCHTGASASNCQMGGNDCLSSHYADTQKTASSCAGKKVGECALIRVNANTMPPGPGTSKCGASPCFSDTEKALIQAWINGGFPQN